LYPISAECIRAKKYKGLSRKKYRRQKEEGTFSQNHLRAGTLFETPQKERGICHGKEEFYYETH
jgi:hypothetical protein